MQGTSGEARGSTGSWCCLVHWVAHGQRARLAQGCRAGDPSFREKRCALGPGSLRSALACSLRMDWHWVKIVLCIFVFFFFLLQVPSLCSVLECVFAPVL